MNETPTTIESPEQMIIYNSFSWKLKLFFKDVMKSTIKYSQEMINKYDMNKVSLEQKVYILKAPDNVKSKAMIKLKEIKGKKSSTLARESTEYRRFLFNKLADALANHIRVKFQNGQYGEMTTEMECNGLKY